MCTARWLAGELGVSTRTVYRDIADLQYSGVPVRGEAGTGYVLERGYELPPLTFNHTEIEALVLGARMVSTWGDRELKGAVRSMLGKVDAVLPAVLRETLSGTALFAPEASRWPVPEHLSDLRRAVADRRLVQFTYLSLQGEATAREVEPFGLYFWGSTWSLAAWCRLRQSWRTFLADRMAEVKVSDTSFEPTDRGGLNAYLAHTQPQTRGDGP